MDLTGRYSLDEQIKCVDREIGLRERLYPKFIDAGKLTPEKAASELMCMREVARTLRDLLTKPR